MLNKMLMRPLDSDTDVQSVYESHEVEKYVRHAQYDRAMAKSEICNRKAIEAWIDDNKSKAESDFYDRWAERWSQIAERIKAGRPVF